MTKLARYAVRSPIVSTWCKEISMRTGVFARGIIVSGVLASLIVPILPASGNGRQDAGVLWSVSEVWVQQARGNVLTGASPLEDGKSVKAAPEGSSSSTTNGSPSVPVTCNQQNASSPACYSATQQAKPGK